MKLHGMPASPGYARGKAFRLEKPEVEITDAKVDPAQADAEFQRFLDGRETYGGFLRDLMKRAGEKGEEELAEILDGYYELLTDVELEETVRKHVFEDHLNAEMAAHRAFVEIEKEMQELDADYARERADDFRNLRLNLVVAIAHGAKGLAGGRDEPGILVGHQISPEDTASIDAANILGIVCETGGLTSHVAILSQALGVPAVLGVGGAMDAIGDGDEIFVDGENGGVLVNPDAGELKEFGERRRQWVEVEKELEKLVDVEAKTADGHPVELFANIGSADELPGATRVRAAGIGLFRTEFMWMNRPGPPSEDEQFEVFRQAAEAMGGQPVVIRTLDTGGDKPLGYLPFPKEDNPFLGWRGVRIYPECRDWILSQIRAILRAGHYGCVKMMFPMVISLEETLWLRELVAEAKEGLARDGVPFGGDCEVGIMIETPASVAMADALAEHVDFFSVGTNDLAQYTLAVDRGNEKVAPLYESLDPAVIRFIHQAVEAIHARGKWIGVCGELAGDPNAVQVLLGLGIDELSMTPSRLLRAKKVVLETDREAAKTLAARALKAKSRAELMEMLGGGKVTGRHRPNQPVLSDSATIRCAPAPPRQWSART